MKRIAKKEEQHTLASRWLHEVEEWVPPQFRRKKPAEQLEGQLDIVEVLASESSSSSDSAVEDEVA